MCLLVPRKICFKCQWNVQWLKYSKEKLSILFLRVFVNTSHVNVCILFYGTLKQKDNSYIAWFNSFNLFRWIQIVCFNLIFLKSMTSLICWLDYLSQSNLLWPWFLTYWPSHQQGSSSIYRWLSNQV